MRYGYLVSAAAYMGLIWILSSQPGDSGVIPPLPYHLDKLAHALEYALLGFLLVRGLGRRRGAVAVAVSLAALYGLSDEVHQSMVAARQASVFDWTADVLGAFAGVLALGRRACVPADLS